MFVTVVVVVAVANTGVVAEFVAEVFEFAEGGPAATSLWNGAIPSEKRGNPTKGREGLLRASTGDGMLFALEVDHRFDPFRLIGRRAKADTPSCSEVERTQESSCGVPSVSECLEATTISPLEDRRERAL